jgi:hypothetical protein
MSLLAIDFIVTFDFRELDHKLMRFYLILFDLFAPIFT